MFDYDESVNYLLSIPLFGKKDGNKNVKALIEELNIDITGDRFKFIHVAGTNGKGSVCTMLSYILTESKVKTGLFTSPHLEKINERIKINNNDIEDDELAHCFNIVKKAIENIIEKGYLHPTYFETLFVLALYYFINNNTEIVVLETGIGGRLDATNVIEKPIVSIITHIGLDHVHILGDTLEKIAEEKGGIIKNNIPAVLSTEDKGVLNVINRICKKNNSRLYEVEPVKYSISERTDKTIDFSIYNKYYSYDGLILNTSAEYQIINLATVLTSLETIKNIIQIDENSIKEGINKFYWPGRMELIDGWLMLDGAHNVSAMRMLVSNMNKNFSSYKITLMFASMKDKDWEGMIKELSKCNNIDKVIVSKMNIPRCQEPLALVKCFEKYGFKDITIEEDYKKIAKAHNKDIEGVLCVAGSLYLVGEIKKIIKEVKNDSI